MTKVSPPRLTLLFSTSVCHSSDIDIHCSEESSGVQGLKKENPSVKTGFGKEKQESGMCLCLLVAVSFGHFELAEGRLRAQRHLVSVWGGSLCTVQLCCVVLWASGWFDV